MSKRKGFSLYLTFLVTTVIFILVSASYEVSRISLDIGRSSAVDAILFHAADGGLERGIAQLRNSYKPFSFKYKSKLNNNRIVEVEIVASRHNKCIDLISTATLYEGAKKVAARKLLRKQIENKPGRTGTGQFTEAS
ncbi:MAG: hypothetical protein Kow0029_14010 [Candidatus Rifleibacteriota bacterium]